MSMTTPDVNMEREPAARPRLVSGEVLRLRGPLGVDWPEQWVCMPAAGVEPGEAIALTIDGDPAPVQHTGRRLRDGAEVMFRLGLAGDRVTEVRLQRTPEATTDLRPVELDADGGATLGEPDTLTWRIPALQRDGAAVPGPVAQVDAFALPSTVTCTQKLLARRVRRLNIGPLFIDYDIHYVFEQHTAFTLRLRFYRGEPMVEVTESFNLGMGGAWTLTWNPTGELDRVLSHEPFEFEGGKPPTVEPLHEPRPDDLLLRVQMPRLGEYVIPNNRGWFTLFNHRDEARGMVGLFGLHGDRWRYPVQNLMEMHVRDGAAVMTCPLDAGERHWLLYAGPVETTWPSPAERHVAFRVQADFDLCRLDEHLDLAVPQSGLWDAESWAQPGVLDPDYRATARRNAEALAPLRRYLADPDGDGVGMRLVQTLLHARPEDHQALIDVMTQTFAGWVRDFQGYRNGTGDYSRSVIGFSRRLRGLMLAYELLRRDEALSAAQVRDFNDALVFAARRISDQGRWPHDHTWQHPDHPESVRDLYTYPGEHKPDRLVWTNSLPNFQSDPLCALTHLGCLLPDHPDAMAWRRMGIEELERQLDAYCGPDGAWQESINYALYTLSYFVITFRILKRRAGGDYFHDERVRRLLDWLVRFLGPRDKRFDCHTYPGVGNARVPTSGGEYLLCFAGELDENDPLRRDLLATYQRLEPAARETEFYPFMLAATAPPVPAEPLPLRPLGSETMRELGVAMRHHHGRDDESDLVQKIGFWKDHYENDETAFNWYAKGTPLCLDYGTYTGDAATAAAHNLVELPDQDPLRRGFLAATFFSDLLDYSHAEVPVTLKLSHGRVRTFDEIDGPPQTPMCHYIGDKNPVGPRAWKTRLLLFIKPDYLVTFDRVAGPVPHRYNLHVTGDDIQRDGQLIRARGRFDLDLLAFVQHPAAFDMQTGTFEPAPDRYGTGQNNPHRQSFFRLYNRTDDVYRAVLFAEEHGRRVRLEGVGDAGIAVITDEYTDLLFVNDRMVDLDLDHADLGPVRFVGRTAWVRRDRHGHVAAVMIDGDHLAAFGHAWQGLGPWRYNVHGQRELHVEGCPRQVQIRTDAQP